jgi:hypothetical protein
MSLVEQALGDIKAALKESGRLYGVSLSVLVIGVVAVYLAYRIDGWSGILLLVVGLLLLGCLCGMVLPIYRLVQLIRRKNSDRWSDADVERMLKLRVWAMRFLQNTMIHKPHNVLFMAFLRLKKVVTTLLITSFRLLLAVSLLPLIAFILHLGLTFVLEKVTTYLGTIPVFSGSFTNIAGNNEVVAWLTDKTQQA